MHGYTIYNYDFRIFIPSLPNLHISFSISTWNIRKVNRNNIWHLKKHLVKRSFFVFSDVISRLNASYSGFLSSINSSLVLVSFRFCSLEFHRLQYFPLIFFFHRISMWPKKPYILTPIYHGTILDVNFIDQKSMSRWSREYIKLKIQKHHYISLTH